STPDSTGSSAAGSVRSPATISTASGRCACCGRRVIARTRTPAATSCSTTIRPTWPVAPVTRTRIGVIMSSLPQRGAVAPGGQGAHVLARLRLGGGPVQAVLADRPLDHALEPLLERLQAAVLCGAVPAPGAAGVAGRVVLGRPHRHSAALTVFCCHPWAPLV